MPWHFTAGTLSDASSTAIEVRSVERRPMLEISGISKRFGAVDFVGTFEDGIFRAVTDS